MFPALHTIIQLSDAWSLSEGVSSIQWALDMRLSHQNGLARSIPVFFFLISQFSSSFMPTTKWGTTVPPSSVSTSGLAKSERACSAWIKHFLARAGCAEEKGAWHWISPLEDFRQGRRQEKVLSVQEFSVDLFFKTQREVLWCFDSHVLWNKSAVSSNSRSWWTTQGFMLHA